MRRFSVRYLFVATAWIGVSLALLQIPVIIPSKEVVSFENLTPSQNPLTSFPVRVFASLSVVSVPTHVAVRCLGMTGVVKWIFGVVAPTLAVTFCHYFSELLWGSYPGALGFWYNILIGLVVNLFGFAMVNSIFSLPVWCKKSDDGLTNSFSA